jgi:hypothetical protein
MKKLITLFLFLFSLTIYSQQQKILFQYDKAGNQIVRSLCINCPSTTGKTNEAIVKAEEIKEEDLQKFSPEDVISYYPNPVKELLFLKWELTNDNKVTEIQLHSLNGQLLKTISKLESVDTQTIHFQSYPSGVYFLLLVYTDGEQKSIKIIKE